MIKKIHSKIRRIRNFRNEAYYTLNGWRFADLKRYLDKSSTINEDSQFAFYAINHELEKITQSGAGSSNRIALISCLPPDSSGIARFSLEHIIASDQGLDVFSVARDPAFFMLNATRIRMRSKGGSRLFPISTLLSMDEIHNYDHVVFVIGNSSHNIETYRAMETFVKARTSGRVVCYLHDPCCHNVVQMAKSLSHDQYINFIERLYGDKIPNGLEGCNESWRVHQRAVENEILGCRAILDIGVDKFMVNSSAAHDLLINDLSLIDRDKVTVQKLYHPVFPVEHGVGLLGNGTAASGALTLGTFGMPGASKRTDLVIEACSELDRRGTNVRLLIAGYDSARYIESYFPQGAPLWLEVHAPETEHDLQVQMARCDMALQFRRRNLGESSGIVPTLLRLNKPVIASDVGAFRDYKGAVLYFEGSAKALADLIASRPVISENDIASYVQQHDLIHFSCDFIKALQAAARS